MGENQGFIICGRNTFIFSITFRLALGHEHHSVQSVLALSLGIQQSGLEADHCLRPQE